MIKEQSIQDAKQEVSIVDVFRDLYTDNTLKKSGSDYVCVCPFHDDHSPSLHVSPKKNRVHCYVCDTDMDIFALVMDKKNCNFFEAVKYIYRTHIPHIPLESIYVETSPEAREQYKAYEAQMTHMRLAHEYYIANYLAKSEEAQRCRQYAEYSETNEKGRWPHDFCQAIRLGYAHSKGFDFVNWAARKGLNMQILEDIGLVVPYEDKKTKAVRYRDFYVGRLMIPICDRYGQTIAFTARVLDETAKPKYLNNSCGDNNLIYKKNYTVFGFHRAVDEIRNSNRAYLMEGAPDAMRLHSIGISNAVASCGSHWTQEQLAQLKGRCSSLCFIPDEDEKTKVVNGVTLNQGEAFTIDNAMLAINEGFTVFVKEIPSASDHKEDVDSYIRTTDIWESIPEEEFVQWYARKLYKENPTNEERMSFVSSVCSAVNSVKDEVLKDIYLTSMKELYPPASMWKAAQKKCDSAIRSERIRKASRESAVDHDKYGFFEKDSLYYSYDKQGHPVNLTNFKIIPLFHIFSDDYSSRVMELVNVKNIRRLVEFKQSSITKVEKFKEETEALGNFQTNAPPTMYEKIKSYVYDHMPTVTRIATMGWNSIGDDGFYAFANGIADKGVWMPVDEYGIVDYRGTRYFIPAYSILYTKRKKAFKNMKRYAHIVKHPITLTEFFKQIQTVWGMNGVISLIYCFASINKDIIVESVDFYPILFYFGVMSSGKTQLATTVTRLFQYKEERNNLESTSSYVIGQRMQSLVNGVVNFDEYKNSLSKDKIDIFKGVYDYSGRSVKDEDNNDRTQFDAESGVILTGQEIPDADPALLSRTIFLEFYNRTRSEEELFEFQKIKEMRGYGITSITIELLKYRTAFAKKWNQVWLDCLYEVKKHEEVQGIDERIVECWTLSYATLKCYKECGVYIPQDNHKFLEACINGMIHQQDVIVSTDEIATFWRYLHKGLLNGTVREKVHFKIVHLKKRLQVTKNRNHRYIDPDEYPTPLIYLSMAACTEAVNVQARKEGKKLISESSLRGYLENSVDFIGTMCASTYFNMMDDKGNFVKKITTDPKTLKDKEVSAYRPDRPLIFDYESLSKKYGVDFTKVFAMSSESAEYSQNTDTDNNDS